MSRIELFGVEVDAVTTDEAVDWVGAQVAGPGRGRILTLNATGMMMAEADEFLRRYVTEAELVVADGQPLVWASPLFATALPERVPGIDLLDRMMAEAAVNGWGVYLLGAEDETIKDAATRLERKHPGLTIVGYHNGFLGDAEAKVAAGIAASGADLLCVGMGMPRQERFLDAHWDDLGVSVAIGVGGTFEVITGRLRRAPGPVQKVGLEWAFRMIQEPRRLGGRYAATFFWLAKRTAPVAVRRLLSRVTAGRR
ncbi:MAG: WecB/TagA/CpsF family glycosyltransferase [Actinomycetota bacterium]